MASRGSHHDRQRAPSRITTDQAETTDSETPFAYRQRAFAPTDTAAMIKAVEQEDGFALIPGVLSHEQVVATRKAIDDLRPFHFDGQAKPGGNTVDHYKCVFNRSPFWLPYLDKPGVIELAEGTMGNECHIIGMSAWRSHPQGPEGDASQVNPHGIHSDNWMFSADERLLLSGEVKVPVTICTAHYYLSDIDLELCPTWVVPGSHMSGKWAQNVPVEERAVWRGRKAEPVLVKGRYAFFRSEGSQVYRLAQPHHRPHALPPAGALRAPLHRAEVFAVSRLPLQPRGGGDGERAAEAHPGPAHAVGLRLMHEPARRPGLAGGLS